MNKTLNDSGFKSSFSKVERLILNVLILNEIFRIALFNELYCRPYITVTR